MPKATGASDGAMNEAVVQINIQYEGTRSAQTTVIHVIDGETLVVRWGIINVAYDLRD